MIRAAAAAADEPDAVVRLERVGLAYGDGDRQVEALRNISLTLEPASFCFLTGPSGAGKTSLLKLMYLSLRATTGVVRLFGVDTREAPRRTLPFLRRRIGVVFQDFRLIDHLSVFDNIALPLHVMGGRKRDYEGDVRDLAEFVGLGHRLDALPATLSGGEKQRAAIARAVMGRPALLIADEPTGNVDPDMALRLMQLFFMLNSRLGTTVVIASHDLELVRRTGANVLRIEDGKLLPRGPA